MNNIYFESSYLTISKYIVLINFVYLHHHFKPTKKAVDEIFNNLAID